MRQRNVGMVRAGVIAIAMVAVSVVASPGSAARAASLPAPGTYVPVGPIRILDTGVGNGAPKASVASHATLALQVSGRGDVPASGVSAVVVNVTVAAPTGSGYVTVYPSGVTRPVSSSVNFTSGRTVPNLVTVRLGSGGRISIYNGSTGSVRLVADVSGYYRSGTAVVPGAFVSLTPARVLDTGSGNGAPKAAVRSHATLPFQVSGRGGVPSSGVSSVVLNVTAAAPTGSGYVTAYPDGVSRPVTSSLNFTTGRTTANAVVVRLGTGGKVSLYNGSTGSVRLVADVAGYFRSGMVAEPGAFTSLTPARVLDTGNGTGVAKGAVPSDEHITFHLAGHGGVPTSGVSAVVLNVTVASETAGGYITVFPDVESRTSNLNFQAAHNVANLVVVRLRADGDVSLDNRSAGTVRLIADVAGYYRARPGALTWGAPISDPVANGGIDGAVSCATTTFCAATMGPGEVATYDGTTWSTPVTVDGQVPLTAISCPTATFCMAVGGGDGVSFNGTTWSDPTAFDSHGGLTSVSCASASFCVAGDSNTISPSVGHAYAYNGSSWAATTLSATGIGAVSCPTTTFCAAGDARGDFYTFDGSSWTLAESGAFQLDGPSGLVCTSSAFCAEASADGYVETYHGTWSNPVMIVTPTTVGGLACSSPTSCVVATGDIGVSTYNGSTWSDPAPVLAHGTAFDEGISCSGATFCVLVTNDGYGSTYRGTSWSPVQDVDPSKGFLLDVSCASATFCVGVTDAGWGQVFNGTSWGPAVGLLPRHVLRAVSCPATNFCLAVSDDGQAVTFDGTNVSSPTSDGLGSDIAGQVSCATPTFCVVGGENTSATFTGSSWDSPVTAPDSLIGLSCPVTDFCVSSGGTAQLFNGTSWAPTSPTDPADGFSSISCATATFCLSTGEPNFNALGGDSGGEDATFFNGSTWTAPSSADSGGWVNAVSCPTTTFCAGAELRGTVVTWDGTSWSDPVAIDDLQSEQDLTMSCPTASFCVALGSEGLHVGRP